MPQTVKNLPAMWETQVQFPGWDNPLEKGMTWRIPWTQEPGGLQSMEWQRIRHDWATNNLTLTLNMYRYGLLQKDLTPKMSHKYQFHRKFQMKFYIQLKIPLTHIRASLVAQLIKNLPAVRETWVQSLSWEDPLEKGKATQSSILAWRISWTV